VNAARYFALNVKKKIINLAIARWPKNGSPRMPRKVPTLNGLELFVKCVHFARTLLKRMEGAILCNAIIKSARDSFVGFVWETGLLIMTISNAINLLL